MSTLICPHCGQSHRQSARFCPMSGKLIQSEHTDAAPPQAEAGLTGRLPPDAILNNRYIILRKIAQGGMGAVYQVVDTSRPGTLWAVKEMSDVAITNSQDRDYAIQAFVQEANLLRRLNHPNLPKVSDDFTEGGKHYLVMEFVPGHTLSELLLRRSKPFTELEVLPWALQLCDVLGYLHSQNPKIIFRDLKPANIMLTPQGQIKVIDFGIARFFKPGKTKDTVALGTPGYAPPEAVGGQTDERSDVYCLAVTMHHLLTMHDPARTMFSLPPVRQLNQMVSSQMEHILLRGLQNQRDFRWPNMQAIRAELARLVERVPYGNTPPPRVEVVTPQSGRAMAASGEPQVARMAASSGSPGIAQTVVGSDVPAVERTHVAKQAPARPVVMTSRPTTRLAMVAARLSGLQLSILVVSIIFIIVVGTWPLAPLLDELSIDWNKVPIIAIFGALGYAAYPRRGMAFFSHTLLSTVLVATIWARLGSQGYDWDYLLLAALASGIFMEIWIAFLSRIKGAKGDEAWLREVTWIAAMEVIGTAIFFGLVTQGLVGLDPTQWALSAFFGVVGWFIGDLLQQFLLYRRTGVRRER